MPKYDFNKLLEPYEFQYLVRDILQKREDCFFESFTEGSDGGVDLRRIENDNTIIVQVKRYNDNFNNLLQSLRINELPKVKKLKPQRYIIVTSTELTVGQKQKIFDLFCDYIKDPSDILSSIDLNNLLGDPAYHHIELNYPNLWFNSSNTFFKNIDNIVNNDIYEESRDELEKIVEMMKYYVPISNFSSVISTVDKNRFLLITGNPGIGKTSLARALCAYYICKENYELIYTRNVESANRVYRRDKKQIFFFDDFWGSSFKENDYNFNEERKLSQFIEKINKSNNKLLILTSRDYVIKQGLINNLELTDVFENNNYILDLKKYSLRLRYMILLRHLYKSKLKFTYVDYIINNRDKIIKHRNFNPRIIEYYLNSDFNLEVDYYKYFEYLIEDLNKPFSFLNQIYKRQSKEAQLLLYLLLTNNEPILIDDLKQLYLNALNVNVVRNNNLTNFDIQNVIEQLEKNFIKTKYIKNHGILVDFVNNSIKDYLIEYWDNFAEFEQVILLSMTYFNQIEFFMDRHFNPVAFKMSKSFNNNLNNILLSKFDDLNIIRGNFGDTIPFEKINDNKQILYKVRRLINKEKLDETIVKLILDRIKKIIDSLKLNSRDYIYKDDLASVIDVFRYACLYEKYDKTELINLYYNNCQHTYELYLISEFKDIFKEEYSAFIKGKKRIINKKYKELIYNDLYYFYNKKMYQSLSELLFLLDSELYNIVKNDEILRIAIDHYSESLDEYYEELDEILEQQNEQEQYDDDMNEVGEFCPKLSNYSYTEVDVKNTLKIRSKNILKRNELAELIDLIENSNNEYIDLFLCDENNIDLVILYYKNFKFFPKKISDFCFSLIDLIIYENKLQLTDVRSEIILIGYETFLKNEQVFSIDTIEDSYCNIDINKKEIKTMLKSKLFISEDKWIKFVNPILHAYCASFSIAILDEKNKQKLYDEIIFSLSPINQISFDFFMDIGYFYRCLIEVDSEGFNKYFVIIALKHFIANIDDTSKNTIIKSIINFFDLGISLDSLKYGSINSYSYSVINHDTWNLFDLFIDIESIKDIITNECFGEFSQLFKDYLKYDYRVREYKIDISRLKDKKLFYDWLEKYEIDKKILEFYNKIKYLSNYCESNYLSSFKEYHDLLEKNIVVC